MPGPDLIDPVSDGPYPTGSVRDSAGSGPSDTEARILDAARDLLAEGGIEALSMRAVASRVALSATALYHYFDNKEALVDSVVQHGFKRSEEYLRRAVEHHPRGSMERVAALGEAYIRFALENRQYFKIIFAIQPEEPRAIDDVPGRGGYRVLHESVVEAMEAGTIRRENPDVVVLFLWSVVHGLVTIFMACDPAQMLDETGLCGGDCGQPEATLVLFDRFRELIRQGLAPVGHVTASNPASDTETGS
ncbi:MAG: TetR/AcrR family transcriptional regulator [marine benthic group bacterium]|jgi:AcrR family transcriptional regulator|nr:TetR/AcrR family transcriptional regulator [Gemmatimonadota bacterium]